MSAKMYAANYITGVSENPRRRQTSTEYDHCLVKPCFEWSYEGSPLIWLLFSVDMLVYPALIIN